MKKTLQMAAMLLGTLLVSKTASSQVTTQTLSFTGSAQSFTAPSCLQATLTCYGAKGVDGANAGSGAIGGIGGLGAMIQGVVSLTAGQVLNVYVGGAGSGSTGGFNGGGNGGNSVNAGAGGGATDIRLNGSALVDRIMVAGGGGGGGTAGCASNTITGGNGGAGGGGNGTAGVNSQAGLGGQGAIGSTGGAAGLGCPLAMGTVGVNGTSGVGGNGGNSVLICGSRPTGGGGGGGYVGGGGGGGGTAGTASCTLNDTGGGGGGAGGTNYFATSITSTVSSNGVNNGDGYVIISYSLISTPSISVNSGSICSGNSFTISPSGATSYTYQGGSSVVTPTASTSYTVIGSTDGCLSNIVTSSVSVNALPTVTVNSGAICAGESFTMVPSGADTYTYSSGSDVVAPTADATYTVTGTDVNGCVSNVDAIVSVTVNALPVITSQPADVTVCGNATGTFSVVATNGDTYSWGWLYSVNSFSTIVGTWGETGYTTSVLTIPNLESEEWDGVYIRAVVTGSNGCSVNSNNTLITVNALPTVTVNSGAICAGQSFTMVPSGASTYTYSNGSSVATPTANATYSVSGTDANGCVSNVDAVSFLTVNPLPLVSVSSGAICAGESYSISATGALTYTSVPALASEVVTPTTTTSYTITGTDNNGCVSTNLAVSTVTVNSLPTISVNSGAICAGQSFTMVPSGAATYTYSNGTDIVTPSADATYSVNGTDANGCVSNVEAVSSITVNALPTVLAVTNNTLLCTGETATLTVSGAASYTWSTTDNTTNIAVSPTVQTTYTVDGTDANGCTNSATITQDVSLCTGVTTLSNDATTKLYPNPNNGLFVIELTTVSKVTVTNALGQVIIAKTFEAGKHSLDINNETTGVYFVKVIENNKQQIIKVIKQ